MGDKRDKTLSELAFTIADHQARIEKLGMKWAAILTDRLDATEKALMAEITAYMGKHSRGLNSLSSLTALHRLEKKIAAIRKEAFAQAQQEIMPEAGELADNEQKWAGKITETLAPESADKLSLVNKKTLNDGIGKQLIESRTAEEWFSGTASADVMRINDMVREGVRSGWTIPEMTRRIVGTKANNYTDGLLDTSRKHAESMARTICSGIANNAKDQFYQENDDVVIGVEWLDTLDSRTCARCGGLSRKRWKTKEPHPVPPLHFSCRCVLIPVTELTDLGDDAFRPAANADFDAEAKELYETKYPGKKYEDLAPSTRKKYFYEAQKAYTARTGNPPYRQVPGGMTFSEYFEQMPEKEKERYLGPGRYKVWKNGNLPLTKFFPPYPERMYSVKELKEIDKKRLVRFGDKKSQKQQHNFTDFSNDPAMIITENGINAQRLNTTDGKKQWEIIPDEVKKVLEHKKVKNIPKTFMLKDDPDQYGFVEVLGGVVKSWNVAHNNPHGALTAVHETGHLVDEIFLTSSQRKRILDIVKSSEEYQEMMHKREILLSAKKLSSKNKDMLNDLNLLLSDKELLARSFTEFEANKNKGALLEQLQKDAILSNGTIKYFPSVAGEIKKAYTEILSEVGL